MYCFHRTLWEESFTPYSWISILRFPAPLSLHCIRLGPGRCSILQPRSSVRRILACVPDFLLPLPFKPFDRSETGFCQIRTAKRKSQPTFSFFLSCFLKSVRRKIVSYSDVKRKMQACMLTASRNVLQDSRTLQVLDLLHSGRTHSHLCIRLGGRGEARLKSDLAGSS